MKRLCISAATCAPMSAQACGKAFCMPASFFCSTAYSVRIVADQARDLLRHQHHAALGRRRRAPRTPSASVGSGSARQVRSSVAAIDLLLQFLLACPAAMNCMPSSRGRFLSTNFSCSLSASANRRIRPWRWISARLVLGIEGAQGNALALVDQRRKAGDAAPADLHFEQFGQFAEAPAGEARSILLRRPRACTSARGEASASRDRRTRRAARRGCATSPACRRARRAGGSSSTDAAAARRAGRRRAAASAPIFSSTARVRARTSGSSRS